MILSRFAVGVLFTAAAAGDPPAARGDEAALVGLRTFSSGTRSSDNDFFKASAETIFDIDKFPTIHLGFFYIACSTLKHTQNLGHPLLYDL